MPPIKQTFTKNSLWRSFLQLKCGALKQLPSLYRVTDSSSLRVRFEIMADDGKPMFDTVHITPSVKYVIEKGNNRVTFTMGTNGVAIFERVEDEL